MSLEVFISAAAILLGILSVWYPSVGTLAITLAILYMSIIIKATLEYFLSKIATAIHNTKN